MRPTGRQGVAPTSRPRERLISPRYRRRPSRTITDHTSRDEARVEACRLPVDHYGACCSPSWSCDRQDIASFPLKLAPTAANMEAHLESLYVACRILDQASPGASSCLLLDTTRSPWALAQAPRMARVAIFRPSPRPVAIESQGMADGLAAAQPPAIPWLSIHGHWCEETAERSRL